MNTVEFENPWLTTLRKAPSEAVTALWNSQVWRGARAKAPLSEFLLDVVPDFADYKEKLGQGILAWLEDRRSDEAECRRATGLNAYLLDLQEAFISVRLLNLTNCAFELLGRRVQYDRWLTPLTTSSARDVRLEYWRVLAVCPLNTSLLPHWVQWVRESGNSSNFQFPARFGSVALRALRALPNGEDNRFNLRVILLALVWKAIDQHVDHKRRDTAFEELSGTWKEIRALYPRSNDFWAFFENEVLASVPGSKEQHKWLRSCLNLGAPSSEAVMPETDKRTTISVVLPSLDETHKVVSAIQLESSTASFEKVAKHLRGHFDYASSTGDSYFLIRTLSNVGTKWLRGKNLPDAALRTLERMAVEGIEWDPANSYVWSLWINCLLKLGHFSVAESVMWDMRRRFPDQAHCRVELARLLMYGPEKRFRESELLLREVISRERTNDPGRVELARLLMFGPDKRYSEAEMLLREVVEGKDGHEQSRVELARLLVHKTASYSEALSLVRSVSQLSPIGRDVLNRLEAGDASAESFNEWWHHSELEFAAAIGDYSVINEGKAEPIQKKSAEIIDPHDPDIAKLEKAAFGLRLKLEGAVEKQSATTESLQQLRKIAVESDPGIAALAEAHLLWLCNQDRPLISTKSLEQDYPGSYAVQASIVWWNGAADDSEIWKNLETRFFNRRAETLALRMLQTVYKQIVPPNSVVSAYEKWRDALAPLKEEAHRDSKLVFNHFLVNQVEQFRIRRDDRTASEIMSVGEALATCAT